MQSVRDWTYADRYLPLASVLLYCRYIVALYSFMRLMGYPAERISILTTYNGQKDLLRDVIEARCARHPLIGRPHKVRMTMPLVTAGRTWWYPSWCHRH